MVGTCIAIWEWGMQTQSQGGSFVVENGGVFLGAQRGARLALRRNAAGSGESSQEYSTASRTSQEYFTSLRRNAAGQRRLLLIGDDEFTSRISIFYCQSYLRHCR